MTFEEAYAARWKHDAIKEGHLKRLPASRNNSGSIRRKNADDAILASVQKGNTCIAFVMKDTGLGKHIVQTRLRYLGDMGKIVKIGHQWRVRE